MRFFSLIIVSILLAACDKGYEVRFSNFYREKMDSVNIGEGRVIFTGVGIQQTTEFRKITKGEYMVRCKASDKKTFHVMLSIPSTGSGKRTIQVDGISQVAVLEE